MICAILLCSSITVHAADEQVKISDKEYLVSLKEANAIYISNEKAVSTEVGTKMFLTYTVEKLEKDTSIQSGIIGTADNTADYPYLQNGRMEYEPKSLLMEEGYTYVYRFEKTEKGFVYECAKLKGDEAKNITFTQVAKKGDASTFRHYGIWIDGKADSGVTAMLNHVRCYDEKGNDLGIHFNRATGTIQNEANALLDVHKKVNTYYSFSIDKMCVVAIGNKYPAKTDVFYMEYEVSDVTEDKTTQQGVIVTKSLDMDGDYPHGGGYGKLLFKEIKPDDVDRPLLKEGGKYFICFRKLETGYEVYGQCTINGKTENFSLPYAYGTYNPSYQFYSLWFGDGGEATFSAKFNKFKCYDAEGNNLGVQITKSGSTISLHGEPEDYSLSKAVYYCKENDQFIILKDDNKAYKQIGEEKQEATYKIQDRDKLYLSFEDGKEIYDYNSLVIRDEQDNQYIRLKNSTTVTFVTGEKNIVAKAEASNGYRVQEPEKLIKEGNTFKGWYLGDGTAFNFDTVVTESITLYAKWQDGDGNEYLAQEVVNTTDDSRIIAILASVAVLGISVASCVVVARKGKRHGKD